MSFLHVNFSEVDTQIAQFARAIALPIRVFIIRMIAENGNSINKQNFYNSTFDARAINKHIMELKSLGIIKVKTIKAQVTYHIDQPMFDQMSAQFGMLFYPVSNSKPIEEPKPELPVDDAVTATSFGQYIKLHRIELNMSQESLAARIQIDRALLSRIECGRKPFAADKLAQLAKALYLSMEEVKLAFEYDGGLC
ncbi:hypothetical protein A0256_07720 [Mucilaginibacter sp. PAMC 26640]|nr:hypothetical protein A0256_07720 [Mucilaginibacter sp. PAMC 26640]